MNKGASELRHDAVALAASLPALVAEAVRVAASLSQGAHGRRRSGPGEAFWQFRRYQPGDPASDIDWRQSAKSDPVYVREKEWEAAQTVWLWVDPSPSMRWRSTPHLPEKRDRAMLLALALALVLQEGGEQVALLGEGPSLGGGTVEHLATSLLMASPGMALPDAPPRRHGHVVLLSDFLADGDTLRTWLGRFAETGAKGHLLQILDPAEEVLPYAGRVLFAGLEGEAEIVVPRADALALAYADRLAKLRADLGAAVRTMGWTFATARTDAAPLAGLSCLSSAIRGD